MHWSTILVSIFISTFSSSRVDCMLTHNITIIGSLVCRLLFQPIEETTSTEFALLLPRQIIRAPGVARDGNNERQRRMRHAHTSLAAVMKLVLLIAGILIAFGPNYSQVRPLLLSN
jgi:hypothetical protein